MSSVSGPDDTTAGGLVSSPPSGCHDMLPGDHESPVQAMWNKSLAVPLAKISSRSAAHDDAAICPAFISSSYSAPQRPVPAAQNPEDLVPIPANANGATS